MSTFQVLETYYSDETRVPFSAITASDLAALQSLASGVDAGSQSLTSAETRVAGFAMATTSVAELSYQFFTGLTPLEGGLDYLVSPSGPDPNNLNSAYYQSFSLENRYINFGVNLGKAGQGAANFAAQYGAGDIYAATAQAYAAIFGAPPTDQKVHDLIDSQVTSGGMTMTRGQYFALYGGDGADGIGTKAAMVGWLLAEAVKVDQGPYAHAEDAFLADLGPDGLAHFHTNLLTTYGPQPTGQPGATITFNPDQSVSPNASNPALQSTSNNDTITGTGGLNAGQTVSTGDGNDTLTIPGVVFGTVQLGAGDDTVTLGGLGASPATLGVLASAGSLTFGSGNDTVVLNGVMAAGTTITATGSDNALHLNGNPSNSGPPAGSVSGFQTIFVGTPNAEGTATFSSDLQTVYDVVPAGSTNLQVNLGGVDGTVFVLQNTSNAVMITYPAWATTTSPAGAITRAPQTPTTAEIHLNSYAGTTGGGAITISGGSQMTVALHVDSNSTAGLISAHDTGATGSVVFSLPGTAPIPNLTIAGLGSLTAQIDPAFTHVDATAAADLALSYTAQNEGSSFLFSSGTDTLNVALGSGAPAGASSTPPASKFVFGTGTDTLNLTTFQNLTIDNSGQTVVPPAEVDGFIKGVDHLTLNAGSSGISANVQQYATGAPTLTQALINVSAHVAANTIAVFEYGGDTYVYQQDSVVGVDMGSQGVNGDGLIRLVGVVGLSVVTGAGAGDIHYG